MIFNTATQEQINEINSNLEIYNEKYLVGFAPVTDAISNNLNNLAVGQTISYNNATAVNMVNAPNNKAARVYCILGFSNNPVQIAFSYNTHSIWIRYYNSGVWSDWKDYSTPEIKTKTVTGTTNSYGAISVGLKTGIVMGGYINVRDTYITPLQYQGAGENTTYIMAKYYKDNSPVANTDVTATVWYVEIT